jgi:hypothetical protein
MQTAEPWHRCVPATNAALPCDFPTGRCSLRERKMSSVVVVSADLFIHLALQMACIDNDQVAEQVAATVANHTFCDTVLPQTAVAGSLRLSQAPQPLLEPTGGTSSSRN